MSTLFDDRGIRWGQEPISNEKVRTESLEREIIRLRKRNKELEKQLSDIGWVLYPDRMGQ